MHLTATGPLLQRQSGNTPIVVRMLDAGANPNARWDQYGTPVLVFAVNGGHIQTVEALLAHGATVDERVSSSADTPLIQASYFGDDDIVDVLVRHGAAIDAHDDRGMTLARWWPVGRATRGSVRKLLEFGADRTLRDNNGMTVITYATRYLGLAKTYARSPGDAAHAERLSSAQRIVTWLSHFRLSEPGAQGIRGTTRRTPKLEQ